MKNQKYFQSCGFPDFFFILIENFMRWETAKIFSKPKKTSDIFAFYTK